jgi:hypothetical protein
MNGELHVVGLTQDGSLYHALRKADDPNPREPGTWDPFGDIKVQAGSPGKITAVSVAPLAGALAVTAATSDGNLWYTVRSPNSGWTHVVRVESPPTGNHGPFVAMSSAELNGELHVVGLTQDGSLYHALRKADDPNPREPGTWDPFGDIKVQAGSPGKITAVSVAPLAGALAVTAATSDGNLWYTVRSPNSGWTQVVRVESPPTGNHGPFVAMSSA